MINNKRFVLLLAIIIIAAAARSERKEVAYVMKNDKELQTAVSSWCSDEAAAEAKYGHISTWDTGRVTSMYRLFYSHCSTKRTFNADISAWDGKCGGRESSASFVSHHQARGIKLIHARSDYL